jgi:hypothetical protein
MILDEEKTDGEEETPAADEPAADAGTEEAAA